jgi:hypothetical protein
MAHLRTLLCLSLLVGTADAFSFPSQPKTRGQRWPVLIAVLSTQMTQPCSIRKTILYSVSPDLADVEDHNAPTTDVQAPSNSNNAYAKSYLKSLQHSETVPHGDTITGADKTVLGVGTTVMVLGFIALLLGSGPGGWRYFLAGGVCAATSHAVATPIDVVKVRVYAAGSRLYGACIVVSLCLRLLFDSM